MKAFVLIIYLLTVTAMVYTADVQNVQIFYSTMENCANQLRLLNQPSPDVLECVLHRFGLIDGLGMLNKYATSRYLEYLISDPNKLWQARYQLESCFNHGNVLENNNHENTMRIIKCAAPVMKNDKIVKKIKIVKNTPQYCTTYVTRDLRDSCCNCNE